MQRRRFMHRGTGPGTSPRGLPASVSVLSRYSYLQRLDRVQPGRLAGRVEPEQHPGEDRGEHRRHDRVERHGGGHRAVGPHGPRDAARRAPSRSGSPTSVSVAASTRNWNMISRRVAPSAFRTPISRVRSVTEIIMIATTPTPPTIRPTLDSAIMAMKKPGCDAVEGVQQLVLRDHREVVVGARPEPRGPCGARRSPRPAPPARSRSRWARRRTACPPSGSPPPW